MPNHFHFLIRIKTEQELIEFYKEKNSEKDLPGFENLAGLVSKQFSNFFNAYSKSFNKRFGRRGSLFWDNIQRKSVKNDDYFTNMIRYVHFNPVLHHFVKHPLKWEFSSIHTFQSEKNSLIYREEVLGWFGGIEKFQQFHQSIQKDEIENLKHLLLE